MNITLSHSKAMLRGPVALPLSKSESNRLLIISALSDGKISAEYISEARDTKLLQAALASSALEINIEDAGTAMRFLTAYNCAKQRHAILRGSERMCQRPISILVNALRDIGFTLEYLQEEGFPPLEILPSDVTALASEVRIAGNVSSQYISALMMIAPVLKQGLTICFTTDLSSKPYIELTRKLMQDCGIESVMSHDKIHIPAQSFRQVQLKAGADWSAAGYWFSMAALAGDAEILLRKLSLDTHQGDVQIVKWGEILGLTIEETKDGIFVRHNLHPEKPAISDPDSGLLFDFTHHPDLAQTLIVLCAAKGIPATFTGLESLRIKETDRIAALQHELLKFGVTLEDAGDGRFQWSGLFKMSSQAVNTYNDHRMAMAFAPLALLGTITIDNPDVVLKSYPSFWTELRKAGFEWYINQ